MSIATLKPPAASSESGAQYSFGIEEEYFLTDLETRDTCREMPAEFVRACRERLPGIFETELLQSQLEVATPPLTGIPEAAAALASYRAAINDIGAAHGLGVVASGTHPKARWARQRSTDKARYRAMMRDLQMLGQRNLVCGMHVHVAVPDARKRVDIMTRATPYLPILLALSTSSPFWHGAATGLMGYRLASYDELPRTGLPQIFVTKAEYDHYVDTMIAAKAIKDSSYIWWAIRPSMRYPTLELRISDSCSNIDDAMAIVALYRALVRRLDRDEAHNSTLTAASGAIALENKWRAQRYGIKFHFIDEMRRAALPCKEALDMLIDLVAADAEALGCLAEVESARDILKRGSSANRQVAVYEKALKARLPKRLAIHAVVDSLLAETAGAPVAAS